MDCGHFAFGRACAGARPLRVRVGVSVAFAARGCCLLSEDAPVSPLAFADLQFLCRWHVVVSPSGQHGEAPDLPGPGWRVRCFRGAGLRLAFRRRARGSVMGSSGLVVQYMVML